MRSRAAKRGVQPRRSRIRAFEANSTAGSPGRRGPIVYGTGRPVTRSTLRTTSSTETGSPLPRLNDSEAPPRFEPPQGTQVCVGEVGDVDVVAQARAVGRRVVVAEDLQRVTPHRRIHRPRDHVDLRGVVLAEPPVGIRTRGVEVAGARRPAGHTPARSAAARVRSSAWSDHTR